jgi:hypothetical protein
MRPSCSCQCSDSASESLSLLVGRRAFHDTATVPLSGDIMMMHSYILVDLTPLGRIKTNIRAWLDPRTTILRASGVAQAACGSLAYGMTPGRRT